MPFSILIVDDFPSMRRGVHQVTTLFGLGMKSYLEARIEIEQTL